MNLNKLLVTKVRYTPIRSKWRERSTVEIHNLPCLSALYVYIDLLYSGSISFIHPYIRRSLHVANAKFKDDSRQHGNNSYRAM